MSKKNRTARKSSRRESKTDSLTTPQSGMIYAPFGGNNLEDWLTSLRQAFPASLIPQQASVREKPMNAISGPTPSESLARWDPDSSCWRTSQASLLTGMLEPLSGSFPNKGMTANGIVYLPPKSERHTSVTGGGVLPLPSPNTSVANDKESVESWERRRIKEKARHRNGNGFGRQLTIMARAGLLSTPTANDAKNNASASRKFRHSEALDVQVGGALSPTFVEWRMGLPIGWTDLKPLGMESYPSNLPTPYISYSGWLDVMKLD